MKPKLLNRAHQQLLALTDGDESKDAFKFQTAMQGIQSMQAIKIFIATFSVLFALLFVFLITGATTTVAGVAGSAAALATAYAAIDASFWAIRNPLNNTARSLLNMNKELGALLILIPMFIFVGTLVSLTIFGWSSVFPNAFAPVGQLGLFAESLRHGFACALGLGFLAALNLPVRFGSLAGVLKGTKS